jgi:tRNA modification GTPase
LHISAKSGLGIDKLLDTLSHAVVKDNIATDAVLVSNMRHFTALNSAYDALHDAQQALANKLPADLVSEDLRRILHHLGEITGDITSDDILHTIFSTFCIGK